MGSPLKVHYITERHFVNKNSTRVWFHSACNLAAGEVPTERSQRKQETTCVRCKNALKKAKTRGS